MNIKILPIIIIMSYLCCYAGTNDLMTVTLPDFKNSTRRELSRATYLLIEERKKQVEYMISQFQDEQTSIDSKGYIIYTLGKLRYYDAIPFLIENIDFDAHSDKSRHYYMLETVIKYPAMLSLIELGTPAMKAILTALKTETNPRRRHLMLFTIRQKEGGRGKTFIETELKYRNASSNYIDSVITEYEAVKSLSR